LRVLPLREGARMPLPLYLVYAERERLGPAAQRLADTVLARAPAWRRDA
jgi:hypothetical protein